jgi:hypothetical protein
MVPAQGWVRCMARVQLSASNPQLLAENRRTRNVEGHLGIHSLSVVHDEYNILQ